MKKILATSLILTLILSLFLVPSASAESTLSGDFFYQVLENGTAEITGYKGESALVQIPSEIEGYKVTSIGNYALSRNENIVKVVVPEGVTDIGFEAFYTSKKLHTIELPSTLRVIGMRAFGGTPALEWHADWIDGGLYLDHHLIKTDKDKIGEVFTVQEGTYSIASSAFTDNKTIKEVILPDSIKAIGQSAFSGCENLEKVIFPSSLSYIGHFAFAGCKLNQDIKLSQSLDFIGNYSFRYTEIKELDFSDKLTYIGNSAFEGCKNITQVNIPESVTYIGFSAFYDCTSLEKVNLSSSLEYLGYSAFYNTAFYNNKLNRDEGLLYSGSVLISADQSIFGSVSVKDGTTLIADSAFCDCTEVTKITLPQEVKVINQQAFKGCKKLMSVNIPQGVEEIALYTFKGCSSLEAITIPEGVKHISGEAFFDCPKLMFITLPESLASVDEMALGFYFVYSDTGSVMGYGKNEKLTIIGKTGSFAQAFATENRFLFKDRNFKYKNKVLPLMNVDENGKTPQGFTLSLYNEEYEYFSENASTPDYVLIKADLHTGLGVDTPSLFEYGDYVLFANCSAPFVSGYGVYIPEKNQLMPLEEAYEQKTQGIENVFSDYGVGMLMGDTNGDGKLNIKDATLIQKHIAKSNNIKNYILSPEYQKHIPDFNKDGALNIRDATAIQKRLAKIT